MSGMSSHLRLCMKEGSIRLDSVSSCMTKRQRAIVPKSVNNCRAPAVDYLIRSELLGRSDSMKTYHTNNRGAAYEIYWTERVDVSPTMFNLSSQSKFIDSACARMRCFWENKKHNDKHDEAKDSKTDLHEPPRSVVCNQS